MLDFMLRSVYILPMVESEYVGFSADLPAELGPPIEVAISSISRLDGRLSASFVARPWRLRAAWMGYARGLQLQGIEIDEIDVLSRACGLELPGRPRIPSYRDDFTAFAPWWESLFQGEHGQWRDELPFTPIISPDLSMLLRSIDLVRQYALRVGSVRAWLALPLFLHRFGLTESPLPCLVGGAKSLRLRSKPSPDVLRSVLRPLVSAAQRGLEMLDAMEADHRRALKVIVSAPKSKGLVRLLTLTLSSPLLSPKAAGEKLGLSISGAGKLLDRAASFGLLVEVSGRTAWKRYLVPDLAVAFGLAPSPKGRPKKLAESQPYDRDLASAFDTFDDEMRLLDAKLATLGVDGSS